MDRIDIIDKVIAWNKARGLDKQEFDINREMGFILEEVLEGLGWRNQTNEKSVQKLAQALIQRKIILCMLKKYGEEAFSKMSLTIPPKPEDIADAFCDIVIFAIGALEKLHNQYDHLKTPYEMLLTVALANDAKGNKLNENGKIIKDENFNEPNSLLKNTADKRLKE